MFYKMKPLLKWVGGKTQILSEVLSEIPTDIQGSYHEPFLGGGSVLLSILERARPTTSVFASDANETLIDLWCKVRDDPEGFYDDVHKIVSTFQDCDTDEQKKEFYCNVRVEFNKNRTPDKFIFLNKTCFRGLWREGPRGFNVPYGNYKNPTVLDKDHLMNVHELIQGVVFKSQGWQDSLKSVSESDWVYMDPPYCNTFTGYTAGSWSQQDHSDLFGAVRNLHTNWVMSNSDEELVRANLGECGKFRLVKAKRAINCNNPGQSVNEVLITHIE